MAPAEPGPFRPADQVRALENILADYAAERERFDRAQAAMLNILEDQAQERPRAETAQRAMLNILDDAATERRRLEAVQAAMLNILDDFSQERTRLVETQRAILNILDDLGADNSRLESARNRLEASDRAIRASLHEKEILLREIHHRVKNNLQVVSSLLKLQSRYVADVHVRELLRESQARVRTIALVHERLYQSKDFTGVDFGDYLRALVAGIEDTTGTSQRGIAVLVEASGISLPIDRAIPCGLIVNELIINAIKHAFPGGRRGTIRVGLDRVGSAGLRLTVADDGVGLPETLDVRHASGVGLELVFTFADQLQATVDTRREGGAVFEFVMPVTWPTAEP